MKEPEITARISELKSEFQTSVEEKLAQFDQHGERLAKLEKEYGFDLDIATDIYGDTLLDPDNSEKVVEQWEELLKAIKENPGSPLVLIRQTSILTDLHVNSHIDNLGYSRRGAEIVLIPSVDLDSFSYHPATEEKQAYIAVDSKDIKLFSIDEQGFVPAPHSDDSVIVANRKAPVTFYRSESLCITDSDCHILYNPSWREAYGLADSVTDELFPLSPHFFDTLRHAEVEDARKT